MECAFSVSIIMTPLFKMPGAIGAYFPSANAFPAGTESNVFGDFMWVDSINCHGQCMSYPHGPGASNELCTRGGTPFH